MSYMITRNIFTYQEITDSNDVKTPFIYTKTTISLLKLVLYLLMIVTDQVYRPGIFTRGHQ